MAREAPSRSSLSRVTTYRVANMIRGIADRPRMPPTKFCAPTVDKQVVHKVSNTTRFPVTLASEIQMSELGVKRTGSEGATRRPFTGVCPGTRLRFETC